MVGLAGRREATPGPEPSSGREPRGLPAPLRSSPLLPPRPTPGGRRRSKVGCVEWPEAASRGKRGRAGPPEAWHPESTGFLRDPRRRRRRTRPLLFLPDKVPSPLGCFPARETVAAAAAPADVAQDRALETLEVWGMGKEVGLGKRRLPRPGPARPAFAGLAHGKWARGLWLPSPVEPDTGYLPELLESALTCRRKDRRSIYRNEWGRKRGPVFVSRCMVHFYKRQVKRLRIKILFHNFKETSV